MSSAARPPMRTASESSITARVDVPLLERELLGHAERHAGREDRDLVDRVGVRST